MHRSCVGVALEEDVNAHCGIVLHCEIAEVAAIEENRGSPRGIRGRVPEKWGANILEYVASDGYVC